MMNEQVQGNDQVKYDDQQKDNIKQYIEKAVDEVKQIKDSEELIKDYANTCKQLHGLLPKDFKKLVKHHYEAYLEEMEAEWKELVETYKDLFVL